MDDLEQFKRDSFVMYSSYFSTFDSIKKRDPLKALEFITAIFEYVFRGNIPDKDDIIWETGLRTYISQIDVSTNRYELSKKGGRSNSKITEEQIYEVMKNCSTWKEVASELNIDEKTLRKLRTEYEITDSKPGGQKREKREKFPDTDFPVLYSGSLNFSDFEDENGKNGKKENPGIFPGGKREEREKPNVNDKEKEKEKEYEKDYFSLENGKLEIKESDEKREENGKIFGAQIPEKVEQLSAKEKLEKRHETFRDEKGNICHLWYITEKEAQETIVNTTRDLYREGNFIFDEKSGDRWEIVSNE